MDIPAIFFIRFFDNHGMLQIIDRPNWWVISGGSKKYVEKMVAGFKDKIKLSTPVQKVKRDQGNVIVKYGLQAPGSEKFDSVIFATHSDQALAILDTPSKAETEILGAIKYQRNDAFLHFDDSILPRRKKAWSSWNYLLDEDQDGAVALTYNMNILQSLNSSRTFCVSLNSGDLVDRAKVIKELSYEHPLYTISTLEAQNRKHEISGINNTFYCGAYWRNGFHEDGVMSALEVCKNFGESI